MPLREFVSENQDFFTGRILCNLDAIFRTICHFYKMFVWKMNGKYAMNCFPCHPVSLSEYIFLPFTNHLCSAMINESYFSCRPELLSSKVKERGKKIWSKILSGVSKCLNMRLNRNGKNLWIGLRIALWKLQFKRHVLKKCNLSHNALLGIFKGTNIWFINKAMHLALLKRSSVDKGDDS